MIILPIGSEGRTGRRDPWATIAIAALLLIVFLATRSGIEKGQEREARAFASLLELWTNHPYVMLPDAALRVLPPNTQGEYAASRQAVVEWDVSPTRALARLREEGTKEGVPTGHVNHLVIFSALARDAGARAHYEEHAITLSDQLATARKESPTRRAGWIPAERSVTGLLLHMLLHAGWLHLIFNLLFLWVAAVALEELWSAWGVTMVFVLSGIAGALMHGWANPASSIPMIGASGAIAGLIGAFLVRLYDRSIRFWYAYLAGAIRTGHFAAPAILMIPLWFAGEIFHALFLNTGPVAYWAHVGGFACGFAIAVLLKLTAFERRALGYDPALEEAIDMQWAVGTLDRMRPEETEPEAAVVGEAGSSVMPVMGHYGVHFVEEKNGSGPAPVDPWASKKEMWFPEAPTDHSNKQGSVRKYDTTAEANGELIHALQFDDLVTAWSSWNRLKTHGVLPELNPGLELKLGRLLFQRAAHEDAARAYERAARANPRGRHAAQALYTAGVIQFEHLGRAQEAIFTLQKLVKRYPQDPHAMKAAELLGRIR